MLTAVLGLCLMLPPDGNDLSRTYGTPYKVDCVEICGPYCLARVYHRGKMVASFFTPTDMALRMQKVTSTLDERRLLSFDAAREMKRDYDTMVTIYTLGHALYFDLNKTNPDGPYWKRHPDDRFMRAVRAAAVEHLQWERDRIIRENQDENDK